MLFLFLGCCTKRDFARVLREFVVSFWKAAVTMDRIEQQQFANQLDLIFFLEQEAKHFNFNISQHKTVNKVS